MGWRKDKEREDEDEINFERFRANVSKQLEQATRKYLRLLLKEKLRWLAKRDTKDE